MNSLVKEFRSKVKDRKKVQKEKFKDLKEDISVLENKNPEKKGKVVQVSSSTPEKVKKKLNNIREMEKKKERIPKQVEIYD